MEKTRDGAAIFDNTFDGDGIRLVRIANGVTTHFVGDWYEVSVMSGVATAHYPFGGWPVAMKQGSTLSFLHRDHLGSLVSATNTSGGELGWSRYYPFGALRLSAGALPSDRLFTGQTRDLADDRRYWFRARAYDATIGQFQSPDLALPKYDRGPNDRKPPQGPSDPQTLDRYAYALNNPLRATDPTGRRTYFIGGIGGAQDLKSYQDFVTALSNAGLSNVELPFTPYAGQSKVVNLFQVPERNFRPGTDVDAQALAAEVLGDLHLNPLAKGEQLNFIALSGGATTAFNAAAILQKSNVGISHLVTLGGVVWEPKPANVAEWTAVKGALDPLPYAGERFTPDQLIVLGDVSHVTLPDVAINATVPIVNRRVSVPILESHLPGPTRDIPGYLDAFAAVELLYLLVGPSSAVGLE